MCARARNGCAPEQGMDVRQSKEWMCARARNGCVPEQGMDVCQLTRKLQPWNNCFYVIVKIIIIHVSLRLL